MLRLIKKGLRYPLKNGKKIFLTIRYIFWRRKYNQKIISLKSQYGKKPIRVGFIGYLDGASCDVFTDLYRVFVKDQNYICEIVTVPYTHDAKEKMIIKHRKAISYVESLGIKPLPGYDETKDTYINYNGRFDITFFEIEYDWVDPLFKINNFRDTLSFIIPYGQYLADNIQAHMNFPMMSEIYCVFPTSVAVRNMMNKYSMVYGLNICKKYLGNPKIDRFFFNGGYKDVWTKAKPKQKRIIWAPHHTWANYSNFLRYSEFMLGLAEEQKDTLFIAIKPHPALKDSLKGVNGWSDKQIETYFDVWKNGENTDLFEGEWYDLFQSSDAMIMDSIGFMLEYSLTGKPSCVLYKVNDKGKRIMKFSECGEAIYNRLYHAKSEDEITSFIKMVIKNEDEKKLTRNTYINENYMPPFFKKGSENIYDYVEKTLNKFNNR